MHSLKAIVNNNKILSRTKGRAGRKISYAGIPRWIMELPEYRALGPSAIRLLLEFCYQYRGSNNGDLCCALNVLEPRGWKSRITIEKARDELVKADLIVQTRLGQFTNPGGVCSLYALRWVVINDSSKFRIDDLPISKRRPRRE